MRQQGSEVPSAAVSPAGRLDATPVAILDFETTGLSPRTGARVVEVAIVRVEPDREPEFVLDTLIDPDGPVHATRIHGITDEDVLGAPLFSDIAGQIAAALEGAVVAAYNASFDIRFLDAEFQRFPNGRAAWTPPHICLMYLRPLLGLGERCSLAQACAAHGLPPATHRAADDALAAAHLWLHYRSAAVSREVTLSVLEASGYKFGESLQHRPFDAELVGKVRARSSSTALKPRHDPVAFVAETQPAIEPYIMSVRDRRRRYWHALVDSLSDGRITSIEIESLREEQRALVLSAADVRALHGKLVGEMLGALAEDELVTEAEAEYVASLFRALRELGWAPGDAA